MKQPSENMLRKSIHKSRILSILGSEGRPETPIRPTKENPLIISASELRKFLRCRVQWNWSYNHKLEPADKPENLAIGTLVGQIIEAYYNLPLAKRTIKSMTRLARKWTKETTLKELSTDNLELIKAMCIGYASWSKDEDEEIGLEECVAEDEFYLPLNKDQTIFVRGKLDLRFQPKKFKNTIACQEMKTAGQLKTNHLDTNLQLSVYLWALRVKYPKFKKYQAYYTQLRKQMPGPRVKADLFAREPIERSDAEVDQWVIDTQLAALDMLDAAIYPNPDNTCSWSCDFQNPCMLRGQPDDLQHVLSTQFKKKEWK